MFTPAYTRQFVRDLKRLGRSGYDLAELKAVMADLMAGHRLESRYKDHRLIGNWQGRRECHLRPDWLLIYKVDREQSLIIFERTGNHADLFGEIFSKQLPVHPLPGRNAADISMLLVLRAAPNFGWNRFWPWLHIIICQPVLCAGLRKS